MLVIAVCVAVAVGQAPSVWVTTYNDVGGCGNGRQAVKITKYSSNVCIVFGTSSGITTCNNAAGTVTSVACSDANCSKTCTTRTVPLTCNGDFGGVLSCSVNPPIPVPIAMSVAMYASTCPTAGQDPYVGIARTESYPAGCVNRSDSGYLSFNYNGCQGINVIYTAYRSLGCAGVGDLLQYGPYTFGLGQCHPNPSGGLPMRLVYCAISQASSRSISLVPVFIMGALAIISKYFI